jgi:hypothetical protein
MSVRLLLMLLLAQSTRIRLTFEEFINNFHKILRECGYDLVPVL